jgi:pimeloyl-ACP methyl ester carboxylesterase
MTEAIPYSGLWRPGSNRGPAIIVGHDWGGALAQVFALRHSSLVAGLVLLNAPLLSTFNALVNNNAEQQAMSSYMLPYLRYQLVLCPINNFTKSLKFGEN